MWTMHDYPGHGDVSKYNVHGYHACPICGPQLQSHHSAHLGKMVYEGHTRFLPIDFYLWIILCEARDKRTIPTRMTIADWKNAWDDANETSSSLQGMKGVNAFYALPYWDELLIHHLLDPMC